MLVRPIHPVGSHRYSLVYLHAHGSAIADFVGVGVRYPQAAALQVHISTALVSRSEVLYAISALGLLDLLEEQVGVA